MADGKRPAGGQNRSSNRKKLKTFHRKGAVKKKLSSSKKGPKVKVSSAARIKPKNRVGKNKGKINTKPAAEKKSIKVNHAGDDNKPIEVLMAALATMPSLNVDELLKHYIEAKVSGKGEDVGKPKLPVIKNNKKEIKAPLKGKRMIVKKKPKTPSIVKIEKAPLAKPNNAEIGPRLGGKPNNVKVLPKKPVQKPQPEQVKENPPVVKENPPVVKENPPVKPPSFDKVVKEIPPVVKEQEESNVKASDITTPQASEEKSEHNIGEIQKVTIVQTAQIIQNQPIIARSIVEIRGKDEITPARNPHLITPTFSVEMSKPVETKIQEKPKDLRRPSDIKEESDPEKKPDTLVGMYLRRQEQVEKEFQSVCQFVNRKRYNQLRIIADEAIKNETTYAICGHSNGYQTVKKFFQSRGWVERFANPEEKPLQYNNLIPAPDNEALVLSKLISRMPVKFVWAEGLINWANIGTSTIVNKFPYCSRSISTKTGLLQYLQSQHWTYSANFSYVKYPRTVSITNEDDMKYFATQYRISACVSMLKHFVDSYDERRELIADHGVIPIECLDFAVQRVCEFVTFEEGTDVDQWNISMVTEDDWILFLLRFLDVAHFNAKYKNTCDYDIPKLLDCARKCVSRVRDFWPDIDHEGVKNLWMVKPGASSCGRGIRIFKSLVEIANHCKPGFSYIAQKYIERPMIIHKTKFDIRQWFLVTSVQPMTVYMYDMCYLRFCSKEFSLVNLHESVHLSNNSVQCRYQNVATRSGELPADNMWDSDQFLSYLRGRKEDDKWFAITLPGIRKGIVGALLASQEGMAHRVNCFNLYGADFMLTEDFSPWLIEINAGPCLRSTTSVTSRLCPMVIEDTLNLALKKKNLIGAVEGGHFRLIYSQKVFPSSLNQKMDISITGRRAKIFEPKNSVQLSTSCVKKISKDDEDYDSPLTYEGRSLNYEKISVKYKKNNKAKMKITLAPYVNQHSPLGPGSILSRFDVSYKPTHLVPYQSNNSVAQNRGLDAVRFAVNGTSALTSIFSKPQTILPTFNFNTETNKNRQNIQLSDITPLAVNVCR